MTYYNLFLVFLCLFSLYNFWFWRFIMILLEKCILIFLLLLVLWLLVVLVLCFMVWLEVFLYFRFMILPLLLHLDDLFLTSLLGFHIITVLLLLALLIKRRLSVKFLVHLVLVLWIEEKCATSWRFWHWQIWWI